MTYNTVIMKMTSETISQTNLMMMKIALDHGKPNMLPWMKKKVL